MSLIIRKMVLRKKNRRAKYRDFPKESLNYASEGSNFELYTYKPSSNPIDKDLTRKVDLYNGSIEDAPIDIYQKEDESIVYNQQNVAEQLYEEYGPGRFNVFIFGGNPPRESVFENTVIREKPENKKEEVKAKA